MLPKSEIDNQNLKAMKIKPRFRFMGLYLMFYQVELIPALFILILSMISLVKLLLLK